MKKPLTVILKHSKYKDSYSSQDLALGGNDMDSLALSALVSAGISSVMTLIVKEFVQSAIQKKMQVEIENLKASHNIEMERLRSELAMAANVEREVVSRRLQAYPRMVSLIYRTRNISRDLARHLSINNISLVDEIRSRAKELEDALYEFRLDLERDRIFIEIHGYKNEVLNFGLKAFDAKYFMERGDNERAGKLHQEMAGLFDVLDKSHYKCVEKLSLAESRPVTDV